MPKAYPELPEEKKQKLMQAAIREFAQNGYALASTNNITKEAGISKGLLFHYFGSKKALFLHLFDECVSLIENKLHAAKLDDIADLFERLLKATQAKMEAFSEQPDLVMLVSKAILQMPAELKEDILARVARTTTDSYAVLLKDIDFSSLREGIEPQRAIGFVMMVLDSMAEKYMDRFKENPELLHSEAPRIVLEFQELIDILRYGLYTRTP